MMKREDWLTDWYSHTMWFKC